MDAKAVCEELVTGSTRKGRKVEVAVEAIGVGVYGEGGGEVW